MKQQILDITTKFYLDSSRFNGCPLSGLVKQTGKTEKEIRDSLAQLIEEGLVSVNFGDRHPNAHILAFEPETAEAQISKLPDSDPHHSCIYPTGKYLQSVVDPAEYEGRPFTLRLALGEPQLKYVVFDLSVLEFYRNDPRYVYTHDDINGMISISDDYYKSETMPERDQVLLETFGFAYNKNFDRAVASFLWYLSTFTPEHQQIWNAKIVEDDYILHPDYYRTNIIGDWPERISVFQAFLEEIRVINRMTQAMGRDPLFHQEIEHDSKPREFCFLIRPTLKEYNEFVHLLDKLISDNINKSFFKTDIALEHEETRRDGTVIVVPKGTLKLLEDWLRAKARFPDPKPFEEMIKTFKKVRKLRQKPAHSIRENEFNQIYFKQQRELMVEAYTAIRTLRLILANHPAARSVEVDEFLKEGKIWNY